MIRNRWPAGGIVTVWMAAAFALSGCESSRSDAAAAQARPALSVELVVPTRQEWPIRVRGSGPVAAWQEAIIGTEVSGLRLKEVLADVGDVVKEGQVLARYDDAALRVEMDRLDAVVSEVEVNLALAESEARRAAGLEASQALSAQVIENHRGRAAAARAQLESAKAQRAAQALKLRHARITAPDDGVITARSATLGAVGTPGAELFRLLRQGRLEWRAEMPADSLAQLKPGDRANLPGAGGKIVTGVVRSVSPTIDPQTHNGIVYVDLPEKSGLVAGMYVAGEFELPKRAALTVPETAIVPRDGYHYVMRIQAGERVDPVKVVTGRRHEGAVEILEGVGPDDRIVRSGGAFLRAGDRVGITEEPGA